jgi:hypothetical protein
LGNSILRSSVAEVETPAAYSVKGDEGLLDTGRMEKAFKGSGIKVPKEQRLRLVCAMIST